MSLKAKLEAVIYAAEEPVTLAQLAALFADEALEWKAQQEAASAEQAAEALPPANERFAYLEMEPDSADFASRPPASLPEAGKAAENPSGFSPEPALESSPEPSAEAAAERSPEPNPEPNPQTDSGTDQEPGPVGSSAALSTEEDAPAATEEDAPTATEEDVAAGAELEARRQARLRDREVRAILRQLLDELIASFAADGRGVEIREIAGGFRMATKPECHDAVRLFVKSLKPALRLSLPALETLAVVAYKQPVTAPEVNEIRGVDSSGVFGSLLARKLIATAGRKPVIGRPILYKTTREFLLRFGLKDLSELPSMEEFEKLAAVEFEEPETADEEKPERRSNPAEGPEFDEAASEELEDSPLEDLETETESPEPIQTAEMAASNESPTPTEAAPAAPPLTEQAETESFPQ